MNALNGAQINRTKRDAENNPCACKYRFPLSKQAYPGAPRATTFRYKPANLATSFSGTILSRIMSAKNQINAIGMVIVQRKKTIFCICRPTSFFFPDPYACEQRVSKLVAKPW